MNYDRMNKLLVKHFMDPADVVVKKDEPDVEVL
jgi:hypothetical protein